MATETVEMEEELDEPRYVVGVICYKMVYNTLG